MAADQDTPRWGGINHLALITTDMDATTRFYHGVLGAQLVATIGTPTFRHYFFELGPANTVAFFEYRGLELDTFAKPAGIPDARAIQFDHVSFELSDEDALLELRDRLLAHDCEVTEVVDHHVMRSIYFTDPNGIALEASWWVIDATAATGDYTNTDLFADPDPVPAVRELATTGRLSSTPRTQLTQEDAGVLDPA
jgi:catechol 2,3-dioxygenase-like lactoylglutathione lyase family enzyme